MCQLLPVDGSLDRGYLSSHAPVLGLIIFRLTVALIHLAWPRTLAAVQRAPHAEATAFRIWNGDLAQGT
ncbi:hypothetical protein BCD48_26855 [Pseudofrankia sp. BMG5.36]|nr:hypothetical protein BCD48_26855 [Pseudofrankia sp. BMG5.36]